MDLHLKTHTRAIALGLSMALASAAVQAADRTVYMPFQPEVELAIEAGRIDRSVTFSLKGTAPAGEVVKADVVTNKKTNAFAKGDWEACSWVMQSALIQLFEAAKAADATKVTNIVSFYKRNPYESTTQFECHAGAVIAGVALKADLAK